MNGLRKIEKTSPRGLIRNKGGITPSILPSLLPSGRGLRSHSLTLERSSPRGREETKGTPNPTRHPTREKRRIEKCAAQPTTTDMPARQKKAPKPAKRSHLEVRWIREWERQGGPDLVEEFQFHPVRKWRADFAHVGSRTLIEIEGGAAGGRHTRKAGFEEDMRKYLTAALHGWEVIRIGACLVRGDIIAALIGRLRQKSAEANGPVAGEDAAALANEDDAWLDAVCGEDHEMPGEMLPDSGGEEGPAWLRMGAE